MAQGAKHCAMGSELVPAASGLPARGPLSQGLLGSSSGKEGKEKAGLRGGYISIYAPGWAPAHHGHCRVQQVGRRA